MRARWVQRPNCGVPLVSRESNAGLFEVDDVRRECSMQRIRRLHGGMHITLMPERRDRVRGIFPP